jgi:hypothetical protein
MKLTENQLTLLYNLGTKPINNCTNPYNLDLCINGKLGRTPCKAIGPHLHIYAVGLNSPHIRIKQISTSWYYQTHDINLSELYPELLKYLQPTTITAFKITF